MSTNEHTTELKAMVFEHKKSIRQRKNNRWLQWLETPENDTKMKILEFQEKCHKPTILQGLERFYKVTPCNEKCNFFILPQCVSLLGIVLIGIIPLNRNVISLLVKNLANVKIKLSSKSMIYWIYSNIIRTYAFHLKVPLIRGI